MATIEHTIARVEQNGDRFLLPEALRIKGELLADHPSPDVARAEAVLMLSWTTAQAQGAASWQLRTAISLGRLSGSRGEARRLLDEALAQMAEDTDTADLRAARTMVATAGKDHRANRQAERRPPG